MATLPAGLLEAVRNYLDIIARGMKYINAAAGEPLDFAVEDKPRELLLDYCRYARSNAMDEFAVNYLHEIISLQNAKEVARYIAEQC